MADDKVVDGIALKPVVGTDLDKKHLRFAADGFQNPVLDRRVRLAKTPINPLRDRKNDGNVPQRLIDPSAGRW